MEEAVKNGPYDLIILGGGPGGIAAAEEACRRKMRVALVEKEQIGGTCLNRGCIPTKTLLHGGEFFRAAREGASWGLMGAGESRMDMAVLQDHKEEILETLRQGQTAALEKAGVEIHFGEGRILDASHVQVGEEVLEGTHLLIATGSVPAHPPIPGIEEEGVLDSDGLLELREIPRRLIIIGGGVIGMECAALFSSLGTEVTVLEMMKRILPEMEKELGKSLAMVYAKRGVDIHTDTEVLAIERSEAGLACRYREKGEEHTAEGELVLLATGRRPAGEGLFHEDCPEEVKSPAMERGRFLTDETGATNVPGLYAIGDVSPGIQLAHVAAAEGRNAVAAMQGDAPPVSMEQIPLCVYTDPEVASVGLTPEEAKERGLAVISKKYPMSANGRSVLTEQERGFVKILAEAESHKVLGAQMMGARVTDMISQFTQAIACGLSVEDMAAYIYPHPSFSEGVAEAAALFGEKG